MRNISRAEFLNTATFALVGLGLYGCGQKTEETAEPSSDTAAEEAETTEVEPAAEEEAGIWVVTKEHRVSTYNGEERENLEMEYELDEQGNVVSTPALTSGGIEMSGSETEYDENGWRTSMVTITPAPAGSDNAEPYRSTTEYQNEYDDEGRLVSATWEEDFEGKMATVARTYAYDDNGNISTLEVTNPRGTTTAHYNKDGFITDYSREPSPDDNADPTSITFEYEWDDAGHLASCTATYTNGYKIVNTYTCDENGNVVSRESRTTNADGEENAGVTTFEYEYEYIENPSMGARILNHLFERVWQSY